MKLLLLALLSLSAAHADDDCPPKGDVGLVKDLQTLLAAMPARQVGMVATSEPTLDSLVGTWKAKVADWDAATLDRHIRVWTNALSANAETWSRAEYRNVLAAAMAAAERLQVLVGTQSHTHPDARRQFRATATPQLERALAQFDATLADSTRRAEWKRQLEAGGKTLSDGVVQVEMLRQELTRRELNRHGGVPGAVAQVPAKEKGAVEEILHEVLNGDYDLEKGFSGTHGDWEVQVLSPGVKQPKFLYLKKSTGGSQGEMILVRLGAEPKVLRVEWSPSDSVKGGLTVAGAEGTASVSNRGVELKALAYIGRGDLQVGVLTVKGYAGGIGFRLSAKDGKVSVGAVAGVGGEVQIDVLGIAQGAWAVNEALAQELAETSTLSWRTDDNGDWVLPNGSTASKAWVRAMMNRPGFHVLPP